MEHMTLASCLLVVLLTIPYCLCFPQRNDARSPRTRPGIMPLVFPTSSNVTDHALPVFPETEPFIPPSDREGNPLCKKNPKDTFCESVRGYPEELILSSVGYSSKDFRNIFGDPGRTLHNRKAGPGARPGDPTEQSICPQATRVFYPKAAENENGQWSYVVNGNDISDKYVQAVQAEMCETPDESCNYLEGSLPLGMTSKCTQKYAYKRLLALHPKEKKTYTDSFKFPSCCVCMVTKPYLSMQRNRRIELGKSTSTPAH